VRQVRVRQGRPGLIPKPCGFKPNATTRGLGTVEDFLQSAVVEGFSAAGKPSPLCFVGESLPRATVTYGPVTCTSSTRLPVDSSIVRMLPTLTLLAVSAVIAWINYRLLTD